jgi:hypothetical protein
MYDKIVVDVFVGTLVGGRIVVSGGVVYRYMV